MRVVVRVMSRLMNTRKTKNDGLDGWGRSGVRCMSFKKSKMTRLSESHKVEHHVDIDIEKMDTKNGNSATRVVSISNDVAGSILNL